MTAKKFLILAEHKKGELKKASLELLKASEGGERTAVIFGSQGQAAAEQLTQAGCQKVMWFSNPSFDSYVPDPFTKVLELVTKETGAQIVLGSASAMGKDLLSRLSARVDAPFAQDCISFEVGEKVTVSRPFYSGKVLGKIEFLPSATVIVSLRPNSLAATNVSGAQGELVNLTEAADLSNASIQFISKTEATSTRPDLTEANIIVSGGRSLKTKENFKIIFDLADALGGAVGASRAACDEGLTSHDMQVGQTGKTVNPSLYIASGISGAIQHLAGMRTSKVIVAINKDASAPIFSKATYGIVGDIFEVVPELTKQAKVLLSKA